MSVFRSVILITWGFLSQVGFSQNVVDWERESETLDKNVNAWKSLNIDSYSFVMDKGCMMCAWYYPAKIVVNNGEIVEVLDPKTDEPLLSKVKGEEGELVFPKWEKQFETIDQLFLVIEKALKNNVTTTHPGMKSNNLIVEYDEVYGFPVSLSVDYSGGISIDGSKFIATDGGLSFRVTEFVNAL